MVFDRDVNIGSKQVMPLKRGDVIVTQMNGRAPETVLVSDVRGRAVEMLNFNDGRPFTTSVSNVAKGRIGRSAIIEEISSNAPAPQTSDALNRLGTDMVVVSPKDGGEEVLTRVSSVDNGAVVLSTPEHPDKQLVRIPEEDLISGESDALRFKLVPAKFSMLLDSERLEKELEAKRRAQILAESTITADETSVHSRDLNAGEVVGGVLPNWSLEDRIQNPYAVFQEGVSLAVKALIEKGEAKALAAAIAVYGGNFMHMNLSVRKQN